MFVGVITATLFTQSIVYGEETINSVSTQSIDIAHNNDAGSPEKLSQIEEELVASKVVLEIEKLIVSLEAQGYSKDQILEILNLKAKHDDLKWPEVANRCIRSATIVALAGIFAWWLKSSYSAYATHKDNEAFDRRFRDMRQDREARRFPGSMWD